MWNSNWPVASSEPAAVPSNKPTRVPCPTCGAKIEWRTDNAWRPFCSERCRLIDLGEWLDEGHRIPGEEIPPNPDNSDT